ncbi:polymer-forming cytoskeletal protein [Janthinobacterium psychrotolerans]|uniref:MSHA biogenesis protein MshQ n=1 Tax=Janthinobacterium psychrotolerans TaxID=1747903 RepID=A0A1A7BU16_9BURK|nr:polymer-forming cytoskeletal protein [Janthinobacterium psychrotolerans]OBV37002.1 MSHA biogenesis protein MshQ [Janthinobacterium psychrotolerans]
MKNALFKYLAVFWLFLTVSVVTQAANLNFNGGAVSACSITGNQYSCSGLDMPDYNNTMVIASGYTVVVPGPISFGYNQSLTMSGTAALFVNGDLDIGNINGPNLRISGGSLTAQGGTFKVGQQAQTLTANVSATNIYLGSGSTLNITGTITATGLVDVASHATVTGPISGSTVHTNSPVVLNGDVTARVEFNLASGSRLTGKLVSPTVNIEPSDTRVVGDVTASKSLTLGSGNFISGNVVAGKLELQSSEAYITGNARVDSIILGWHGRVRQQITCNAYTPSTPCSCVSNNSGYDAGTVNGPSCAAPQVAGPHHFQITHPAAALSCAPGKVTVKACADASCGTAYTNGATVVLSPGGATAQTGNTGSVDSTVAQYAGGTATLSLTSTPSTTGALVCKNSATGNVTNCQMPFNSSGLQVSGDARYAEDEATVSISALQASGSNPKACVPLFANQDKAIKLKCTYNNPDSGTLPARIQGTNGAYVPLGANESSACSTTAVDVMLKFDATGEARPNMLYADAGQLGLVATYTSNSGADKGLSMTGEGRVIVAPASFAFTTLATPQRAGLAAMPVTPVSPSVSVTISAVNAKGGVTRNFGREKTVQQVVLDRRVEAPIFAGHANPVVAGTLSFLNSNGVIAAPALIWPEVGRIKFTAGLQSSYLDSTLQPLGSSNEVTFVPHHFVTELIEMGNSTSPFPFICAAPLNCAGKRAVYSRQPFALRIRAETSANQATLNFDARNKDLTGQVVLNGYEATTANTNSPQVRPAGSTLTDDATPAATVTGMAIGQFSDGIGTQSIAYQFPVAFSLSPGPVVLASPTDVMLRASYNHAGVTASSAAAQQGTEAQLTVLTGRAMVPNSYGSELLPIRLAVQAQYWDGTAWRINLADSKTRFGKINVVLANCLKQVVCNPVMIADQAYQFSGGVLAGNDRLTLLAPKVAGSVDVSVGGFSYLPSSVGRVVFGVFRSGPVLYLREMY